MMQIPYEWPFLVALAGWWIIWLYVRFASGMMRTSTMLALCLVGTVAILLLDLRWRRNNPEEYHPPIMIEVAHFDALPELQDQAIRSRFSLMSALETVDVSLVTDDFGSPRPDSEWRGNLVDERGLLQRARRRNAQWAVAGALQPSGKSVQLVLKMIHLDAEGGVITSERVTGRAPTAIEVAVQAVPEVLRTIGRRTSCEVCLDPYDRDALDAIVDASRQSKPERVERVLRRSLARHDSLQPLLWTELAEYQQTWGKYKQADVSASRALTSVAKPAAAWRVLAWGEWHTGSRKEAARLWRRAVAEDPRDVESLLALAKLAPERAGAPVNQILRQAVSMRPGSAEARLALADVLESQQASGERALDLLREGYRRTENPRFLVRESAILIKNRRWNMAESVVRKALEVDSSDANSWYNLGMILRNLGQVAQAREALNRSLMLGGPVDTHLLLGLVQEAAGDTASALESYRIRWALRNTTSEDRGAEAARLRIRNLSR